MSEADREHGIISAFNPVTRGGFVRPDLEGVDAIRFYLPMNSPVQVAKGDRVTYKAKIREGKGRKVFAFGIRPEKLP